VADGPYHYRQAEGNIEYALSADEDHSHEDVMRILAVAQVHATLAAAAAHAGVVAGDWTQVLG
jgi:hypothetical protein